MLDSKFECRDCRGHGEVPANGGILARKRLCSRRYERGDSGSPSGKSANAVFIFYFLLSRACVGALFS